MMLKLFCLVVCIISVTGHPSLFDDLFNRAADLAKQAEDKIEDIRDDWKEDTDEKTKGIKDRFEGFKGVFDDKIGDVKETLGDRISGISTSLGETFGDLSGTISSKAKDAKESIGSAIADIGNLKPDGPLAEIPGEGPEPEDDIEARSARKNKLRAPKLIDTNEYLPLWPINSSVNIQENAPISALWLQFALANVTNTLLRELEAPNWVAMFRALGPEKEVLKRYASISNRFELLEAQCAGVGDTFRNMGDRLPNSTWATQWEDIEADILSISNLYQWFEKYQNNMAIVNERTLIDYAESLQGEESTALPSMLKSIHMHACGSNEEKKTEIKESEHASKGKKDSDPVKLTEEVEDMLRGIEDHILEVQHKVQEVQKNFEPAPSPPAETKRTSAFEVLRDFFTNKVYEGELCSLSKSPQQLVYDLYNLLALTDAKGYAMMQFSWMVLRLYDKGNFSREAELARKDFERRVVEKAEVARKVISQLSNWYDTCISSKQVENETYIQFTELLQGYMVNEVDLNKENTCKEECKAYKVAEEMGCHKKTFCNSEKRCDKGKLYSCTFFEADSSVCISTEKHRRYDWIEYKSGRVIGQRTDCKNGRTAKADSWWRFLYHCSNCICLCDQPGPRSDRYVSLIPTTVNTLSGNIVTGVRFVKQGRVVYVQIQEGKALPRGAVNTTTLNWRPVERIVPNDESTALINKYSEYATLSWQERAIDLDHLTAPEGHVITGIRFKRLGGHINLEIEVAPIQFSTGRVDYAGRIWVANDNTPASDPPRKQIPLLNADTPLRFTSRPLQDSGDNQYIEFQASSIEKDVGQTTVPFLDAQAVVPQPPMWLTGVALVHKGAPGYGGFISFKVATYDMTSHILLPTAEQTTVNQQDLL